MNIGIVGDGPAVESLGAAFSDIDATVSNVDPSELGAVDLAVVVAPAGADAFSRANETASRWLAVEIGGVGGYAVDELDASVAAFGTETGCYECLRKRVASNCPDEVGSNRPRGDRSAVRLAGAIAGRRAIRSLVGEPIPGTVVEVPGPERTFLPVPGCGCGDDPERTLEFEGREASLDDALARAERALDGRVGAIRQVGERESFPVPYYLAQTADTTGFSDARAAEFAAGVDSDWNAAFMKALGEGLERYCAGIYRSSAFTTARATDVDRPVPPSRFVRPAGTENRRSDREDRLRWVEGVDLATGDEVSLPAEFVHFPPPERRHKPPITTGLGLGNSTVEATLSGLYEVVERDATMLAWYSTFEPLELDVDSETFETLVGRARAEGLSATAVLVTQDVDVPVVAAAVHRETAWPRFAMGSGAELDAAAAAESALAEALQNWMELRAMGPDRAVDEEGPVGRYAEAPGEARAFVEANERIAAEGVGGDPVSGETELETVVTRVASAGLDAYASRVTTRDVAELGFEAVRVLVPDAQPLFTGDPFFGDRAESVPRELGFEPRLERAPHPYP
ncbi:YcaO-like family protein [Halegenticoccus tardaugens]|uniref:YcaO-like family protein n=1 Tax=Halegenticoccus tardaugens TaxID=2071624 RepID=UPI00100C2F17|nr:YcaO-like family protein [Halegenticoccus tardaugens]